MKILMSDFDGTFFLGHEYNQKFRDTVREWKSKGNVIAISTARCACRMYETAKQIDLDCDYYICEHGAIIFDENWNVVSFSAPDKKELMDLFDRIVSLGIDHISVADGLFEYALCPDNKPRERETVLNSPDEIREKTVTPVSIHAVMSDAKACYDLCEEINGDPKSNIFASYCGGKSAFFFKKGNDKCIGGYKLLRLVGGEKKDLYAIGDSGGDVPMIAEFSGYAIKNSNAEAVAAARKEYPTVCDLMRDIMDGKE
jgi:hydroxymethylpyrimidine pyrophosphatase-like HAD family hydrolase